MSPSIPRKAYHQAHHVNTPASSPGEYYKREVTIPFLDHLLLEMNNCFGEHSMKMFEVLKLMPPNVFISDNYLTEHDLKDFLLCMVMTYSTDLQFTQNCIVSA